MQLSTLRGQPAGKTMVVFPCSIFCHTKSLVLSDNANVKTWHFAWLFPSSPVCVCVCVRAQSDQRFCYSQSWLKSKVTRSDILILHFLVVVNMITPLAMPLILFDLILNVPVNIFSVISGWVFLGWTSIKTKTHVSCSRTQHSATPLRYKCCLQLIFFSEMSSFDIIRQGTNAEPFLQLEQNYKKEGRQRFAAIGHPRLLWLLW